MGKTYYYVLVFTRQGPKYVSSTEYLEAKWHVNEKPKSFTRSWAKDIAFGLNANGYPAVVVQSPWEIEDHPYRYEKGEFEWKWKEEDK